MKNFLNITKISEEKIFVERFWDNGNLKFSGYYLEMPEELIDESIGTKIQLNEYETGLPKNRRHNKVVIDSSPTFGYRDGEALWYHKNGNLKQKIPYKEGSPHGIQEMYHENGQLKKRGRHGGPPVQGYSVGKGFRVGIWEFWDEDGTKLIPKKYEYDE